MSKRIAVFFMLILAASACACATTKPEIGLSPEQHTRIAIICAAMKSQQEVVTALAKKIILDPKEQALIDTAQIAVGVALTVCQTVAQANAAEAAAAQ